MRAIVVVSLFAALALAGCTQGTPERDNEFQPTCPSWIKGLSTAVFSGPGWFHPNGTNFDSTDKLGGGGLNRLQDHPLDMIELDFFEKVQKDQNGNPAVDANGTVQKHQQFLAIADAILQVQFFRNDTGEALLAYDSSKGPPGPGNQPSDMLTWFAGPQGLVLTNFTIHIDLVPRSDDPSPTIVNAYWTLVRNVDGNPDTVSGAERDTTAYFWYRTCNADGSDA